MNKDATNLKKWLVTMDIDVPSDEMVKKLTPRKRQDMWRNIVEHVKPVDDVYLIKQSLLLHKIQKLQKPLPAKVESEEDLANALKYEELLSKYHKIEKEIVEIKNKNSRMKIYFEKMKLVKDNLNRINEFSTNKSSLAQHKIKYYNTFLQMIKHLSAFCGGNVAEVNKDLTITDYYGSLIECFNLVDSIKQAGTMNEESVNLGKVLCKDFYSIIKDKSPAILIHIIEDNLRKHSNEVIKILTSTPENCKNLVISDSLIKFFQENERKELKLKTILSESKAEKLRLASKLTEDSISIKNDIISHFKLPRHTQKQRYALEINVSEAFEIIIKNILCNTNIYGLPGKSPACQKNIETLGSIKKKAINMNKKYECKALEADKKLKILKENKNYFRVARINSVMEKIVGDYSNKVQNMNEMKKIMIFIQYFANSDVVKTDKAIDESYIKKEDHKFRTLEEISEYMESLYTMPLLKKAYDDIGNFLDAENNFDEIKIIENYTLIDVNGLLSETENKLS